MRRVGVYDQIKSVFQDIVAPEIHALRGEMHAVTTKVDSLRNEMGSLRGEMGSLRNEMGSLRAEIGSIKAELVAEIRRVDTRIDGVERELRIAIDIRERLAALEARRS
jgi:predicted  nucleic acid-binding Zn-ribbon protein